MFQITVMNRKGYATDIGDFVDNFLDDEKQCVDAATLIETGSPLIFVQDLEDLKGLIIDEVTEI